MEVHESVSAILKEKGGQVSTVRPDCTVYDALVLMAQNEIGSILVMEDSRLVGLFSERDYARKVALHGRSSKETIVKEVMVSPPITVSPDCSIAEAMRIMTESRVRHLPVVDKDGATVGIISIGDAVKWIISSQEKTIEHLQSYIAGNF